MKETVWNGKEKAKSMHVQKLFIKQDREELWWEIVVEKDSKKIHMTLVVLLWVDDYKLEVRTTGLERMEMKVFLVDVMNVVL